MRYLSLDVGTRRTGIAYLDDAVGIPLPLDTLHHESLEQLTKSVLEIVRTRGVGTVIIGLPKLPSGDEGSQASISREVGTLLQKSIDVRYVDERYTTPKTRNHKNVLSAAEYDGDAAAACALLSGKIDY